MPWQGDATQNAEGSNLVLAKDFSCKISVKFYLYGYLVVKFLNCVSLNSIMYKFSHLYELHTCPKLE